ncbi:MAG: 4-hydroxyphenylpyruvate dioxygenase [Symploca sp. SIO2B6]|nr:4-hydroxyphenylpyruvate dioxygenase [Symploca sp. SIO2B6]
MTRQCPIIGFDHVEFYVSNAKQTAYVYQHQFGLAPIAFRGLETGHRKGASYLLTQNNIRFVVSSGFDCHHPINVAVNRHGDGVGVIAFTVMNVPHVYQSVVQAGAKGMIPPTTLEDKDGRIQFAAIQGYGDGLFKFVDRHQYRGLFEPYYLPYVRSHTSIPDTGLMAIDHLVGNVDIGMMDHWADFFIQDLGFQLLAQFDQDKISTPSSALMSKVVQTPTGSVRLPINEPAPGQRMSQIEEYLKFNQGPGVQHIALSTDDIISTVQCLKQAGVEFLSTPLTYYDDLMERVGPINEPIDQLAELGILVDRDTSGYLLQIFTQPMSDRPTLFFEIIQRHNATSFGEGNFKALFAAIEREQARRGNL